jgi:hypothetical protein
MAGSPAPGPLAPATSAAVGVALFLFIPAVLVLFVAHPEPIAASLAAGVVLMLGHRLVATPYFRAIRPSTCAWCHRTFDGAGPIEHALDLEVGDDRPAILTCGHHADPVRRFFAFLERYRWPLRLGIGAPLLLLLAALGAAAAGRREWLEPATQIFRLVVGIAVHVAALGPLFGSPQRTAVAAFPVHNFYLLGIRAILWIFRLVGAWWIVSSLRWFFA